MPQVDEGLIHAWLDRQLSGEEAARVARLVATDPAWEAAAVEARGLIAGSSRALSALDDVPRVGGAARAAHAAPMRRSLWRAPWLRVAAGVVFVAGVTGLLLRDFGGGVLTDQERRPVESVDAAAPKPATSESKTSIVPPPAVARAEARASTRVASARDTVANVLTGKIADAGRVRVDTPPIAAQRVTVAAPPVPLVEQGVVGAVAPAGARLDARLAGCWVQVDSAGTPVSFVYSAAEADAAARDIVALRFVAPVATDLAGVLAGAPAMAAGVGGGRGGRGAREAARALAPQPRLTAVPTKAFTRMLPDSSYAAEFVDARGHSEMTFTVAGDTLRGTMRRSAGDVRFPVVPFRAERADCPR